MVFGLFVSSVCLIAFGPILRLFAVSWPFKGRMFVLFWPLKDPMGGLLRNVKVMRVFLTRHFIPGYGGTCDT